MSVGFLQITFLPLDWPPLTVKKHDSDFNLAYHLEVLIKSSRKQQGLRQEGKIITKRKSTLVTTPSLKEYNVVQMILE